MKKTHVAFRFNVDLLKGRSLYLWTFTQPECVDVDYAVRAWAALLRDLIRHLGFRGVRVFEMHQSHGLHVHVLTDVRYDVDLVRVWSRHWGWGRIHVKKIPREKGHYLGKYLSKGDRPECFKGRRLWATFGKWAVKSLVASVVCYSSWYLAYRSEACESSVRSMGYSVESRAGVWARCCWAGRYAHEFAGLNVEPLIQLECECGSAQSAATSHV